MGCLGQERPSDGRVGPQPGEERDVSYDDHFDGPLKKRSCTDVFFLILLIASLGGMVYVAYLGVLDGDPYIIINGRDSWGNTCNKPNTPIPNVNLSGRDMTGLRRVYFFQFSSLLAPGVASTPVLCVKKCPDLTLSSVSDLQDFALNYSSPLCRYDVAVKDFMNGTSYCPSLPVIPHQNTLNRCVPKAAIGIAKSILGAVTNALSLIVVQCEEAMRDPSQNILNRCVPKAAIGIAKSILGAVTNALSLIAVQCEEAGDFWQRAARDIENSWKEIFYLSGIAVAVALVITFLMGLFAKIVIWIIVIAIALGSIAGTGYCWYTYNNYKTLLNKIPEDQRLASDANRLKSWLIYSCLATAGTAILLLLLLIMRSRIALVAQLFREAGKSLLKIPMLLLQPVWTLIILAGLLSGLVYLFMYIETAGQPHVEQSTGFVKFKQKEELYYLKWYYIFCILWLVQFIFACHQMVVSGAVAIWYFSREKKLGWPIFESTGRLVRYHLGSVAFGSLIIALVQLARIILGYIQKKLTGRTDPLVAFLLKCLQCCLWCFEKVLKYINKNAYIMIAIYGTSFCKGARRAFTLLLSNVLRVAAINSVGTFILFLGKAGVVTITVVIGLQLFKSTTKLCYIWVPLLIAGIVAYLVAHTFLSVYGTAIDTIFLCFCEDCERNDGQTKPYYMSKDLMVFVENSKEALEALKRREKFPRFRRRKIVPVDDLRQGYTDLYPPPSALDSGHMGDVPGPAVYHSQK